VVSAATSATQVASRLWLVEPSLWICSFAVVVIGSAIPFASRPAGRLSIVTIELVPPLVADGEPALGSR
jgi:hypothetical protein